MSPFQPKTALSLEELERAKLEQEIQGHTRPFFRNPAFFAVVGPTLLAAASLGIGFWTGFFDLERERLENEKTLLKIETAQATLDLTDEQTNLEIAQAELSKAEVGLQN